MNARGARLRGSTLTLTGVSPNSIVFADRPVRAAGHLLTEHLLEEWSVGSFAKDPPNATLSVLSRDGASVRDAVVELKKGSLSTSACSRAISPAPMDPPRFLSTSSACRSHRFPTPVLPGARRGVPPGTAQPQPPQRPTTTRPIAIR
jgi:hypothetical protein